MCLKVCCFLLQNFLLNRITWNLKTKIPVKIKKKFKYRQYYVHSSLTDNYRSNARIDKRRNFKVCHPVTVLKYITK